MTGRDDLHGEMAHSPADDRTIDLLLGGRLRPEDCPADLAGVAVLVRAARQPASAGELAGGDDVISAIAGAVLSAEPELPLLRGGRRGSASSRAPR